MQLYSPAKRNFSSVHCKQNPLAFSSPRFHQPKVYYSQPQPSFSAIKLPRDPERVIRANLASAGVFFATYFGFHPDIMEAAGMASAILVKPYVDTAVATALQCGPAILTRLAIAKEGPRDNMLHAGICATTAFFAHMHSWPEGLSQLLNTHIFHFKEDFVMCAPTTVLEKPAETMLAAFSHYVTMSFPDWIHDFSKGKRFTSTLKEAFAERISKIRSNQTNT